MERKRDEEFDFWGYTLKVERSMPGDCYDCFFCQHGLDCSRDKIRDFIGQCGPRQRQDRNYIVFKDISDEIWKERLTKNLISWVTG